jgi:hypothetical protein
MSPRRNPTNHSTQTIHEIRYRTTPPIICSRFRQPLHAKSRDTEKELLEQRVELGRILLELKQEVGHGNFMASFAKWVEDDRINFSLKTAQRAMSYAELDADGKFDSVSNLAEAERVVQAERQAHKQESQSGTDTPADEEATPQAPASLPRSRIGATVLQMARPLIREFNGYEPATRRLLLEELIELLTAEHERTP